MNQKEWASVLESNNGRFPLHHARGNDDGIYWLISWTRANEGVDHEQMTTTLPNLGETVLHLLAWYFPEADYKKIRRNFLKDAATLRNANGLTPDELAERKKLYTLEQRRLKIIERAKALGIEIKVINGEPSVHINDVKKLKKLLLLEKC